MMKVVGQGGLGVLHQKKIGRCDFLYSGAFLGWPLTKKSFRFIAYVC